MPKPKKPKTTRVKDPQRAASLRRGLMHTLAAMVFAGLLGAGYVSMRRYVEREVAFSQRPPTVVLKNRPPWMSDALAIQIINSVRPWGAHSAFERQLLIDTTAVLQKSAWIKQVNQVRRAYGRQPGDTLEIDCEYRAPIALVHWKDYFWLVDGEAVKLPEQFTAEQLPAIVVGPNGHLNIRIIEGVGEPPVESGQKWTGEDLNAALDMAKVLYGQTYADEIVKVNVANFAGRVNPRDAQITLVTRYDTEIRWGQPVNAKDFFIEIPPSRKLELLGQVFAEYHRVDGGRPSIDIRVDKITYPRADAPAAAPRADAAR
jgi:hypothetical protein